MLRKGLVLEDLVSQVTESLGERIISPNSFKSGAKGLKRMAVMFVLESMLGNSGGDDVAFRSKYSNSGIFSPQNTFCWELTVFNLSNDRIQETVQFGWSDLPVTPGLFRFGNVEHIQLFSGGLRTGVVRKSSLIPKLVP